MTATASEELEELRAQVARVQEEQADVVRLASLVLEQAKGGLTDAHREELDTLTAKYEVGS